MMLGVFRLDWRVVLVVLVSALASPVRAADWKVLINPENSFAFRMIAGDETVLNSGAAGWGPNWAWLPIASAEKAKGDQLSVAIPVEISGKKSTVAMDVKSGGPNKVVFEYSLKIDQPVPITQIVSTIGAPQDRTAKVVVTGGGAAPRTVTLPMNPTDLGTVEKISITSSAWSGPVEVAVEPPLTVNGHGELRIRLAADTLKAGVTRAKLTWTFPEKVSLLLKADDVQKFVTDVVGKDWFAYQPKWDFGPSAIGAEDWLDKPAGKHGGVRMNKDQFVLEDGTPIRFWGTNLSYGMSAPTKDDADFTAARFAKYGVDAVRLHKFTGAGWEGIGSEETATEMTPDGLKRLDYFSHQLASRGVYYGWSHTYHFKVRPKDRARISGFDELMAKGGDTYGVINWAEDVQDLLIETVVNLLKHKNPHTGKTYAEDPALCFVELHNEDDIFFYTSEGAFNNFPTYRKLLQKRFAEWLAQKYGTQDKLATAWGGALGANEKLSDASVVPQTNPWHMSDARLPNTAGGERLRLLDNAAFLHELQNRFYSRFVKAIRDTGYQGPLVGSPWQAPGMLPHYYNLRSDALVGFIDRHNYFGGGFKDSMLNSPGGGYLSSGLQQVAGRPFSVSEWIHVYPSLYSAEGPVIMAAYGMGLQGWGASFEFQSGSGKPDAGSAIVGNLPWGVWNADTPTQLGQYPLLSRMIYRGDVKTAPILSVRRVSPQELQNGQFSFSDSIKQQHDLKTFTGSAPAESLAAGRAVVEFTDTPEPSIVPNMSDLRKGTVISATTGQLAWDTADGGVITINTPGTQGYVGFANDKSLKLADVEIAPKSSYASILLTAANIKDNLATGQHILLGVVGRNSNKGFQVLALDNNTIVNNGSAPIMLEPVRAEITFPRRQIAKVIVLDHDGRPTSQVAPVAGNRVTIDTGKDHAIYYEVQFKN